MCEHGNVTKCFVYRPAHLSYTGSPRYDVVGIDNCLVGIVEALNDKALAHKDPKGFATIQTCCGHHKGPGVISLLDGRCLVVCEDVNQALELAEENTRLHTQVEDLQRRLEKHELR